MIHITLTLPFSSDRGTVGGVVAPRPLPKRCDWVSGDARLSPAWEGVQTPEVLGWRITPPWYFSLIAKRKARRRTGGPQNPLIPLFPYKPHPPLPTGACKHASCCHRVSSETPNGPPVTGTPVPLAGPPPGGSPILPSPVDPPSRPPLSLCPRIITLIITCILCIKYLRSCNPLHSLFHKKYAI